MTMIIYNCKVYYDMGWRTNIVKSNPYQIRGLHLAKL